MCDTVNIQFVTLSFHHNLETKTVTYYPKNGQKKIAFTQCPAVFCLMRSFTKAFLLPNNFIARRLSVGWNHDCSWFFRKFDDIFSVIVDMFGNGSSSFGVPYKETSSKWTCNVYIVENTLYKIWFFIWFILAPQVIYLGSCHFAGSVAY